MNFDMAPEQAQGEIDDFMRALAYARVGREDAARQGYRLALDEWKRETTDHPEAWERSSSMRWRRAAEAALSD